MIVREDECEFVGVDAKKVARLARRLEACAKEARTLGVSFFGGSGAGSIRAPSPSVHQLDDRPYILASLGAPFLWDGGDGACMEDQDGLMRGEGAS